MVKKIKDRPLRLNKVLCLVTIVALIIGCLFTSFVFAQGDMEVDLGIVNGTPGGTVTVPVSLKNVPTSGIYTCNFWISFDPKEVTAVSVESGNLITDSRDFNVNYNNVIGFATVSFEAPVDESRKIRSDGVFAKIQFKIIDTAKDGAVCTLTNNVSRAAVYANGTDEITGVKYSNGLITVGTIKTPVVIPTTTTDIMTILTPAPMPTPTVDPVPTASSANTETPVPTPTADDTGGQVEQTPEPVVLKDITTHWAKQNILKLSSKGIIQGYPDGTIKPDNNINRSEAVVVLMKAKGYSPSNNPDFSFADNNDIPSWAKGYLRTALDVGVVRGYNDNTFRPKRNVTRQEVVVMLMSTFGFDTSGSTALTFNDGEKAASWAKSSIQKACELGIVTGYSDNTFKPEKNVTRAELFTMVSKCLDYLENQ